MSLIVRDAELRLSQAGPSSGSSMVSLQGGSHTQAFHCRLSDIIYQSHSPSVLALGLNLVSSLAELSSSPSLA